MQYPVHGDNREAADQGSGHYSDDQAVERAPLHDCRVMFESAEVFVRDELSASVATPPSVMVIVLDGGGSPDISLKGAQCHRFKGLVVRKLNHFVRFLLDILFNQTTSRGMRLSPDTISRLTMRLAS